MSESMIPRISVPDVQDSLLVSNALIAYTKEIAKRTISVESYITVMRRVCDLLDSLSEEANQAVTLRSFGLTPDDLKMVDEFAQKLGEDIDPTGENR